MTHSNDTVSKGQLLFLVRRVTSEAERDDLISRHFIFADPQAVATALHKTLSVPTEHTIPLLSDIRMFCDSTVHIPLQSNRLYAGVAVVQATPFDGLRILLDQKNRSQLPMRELCAFSSGPSPKAANELMTGTLEEIGEAISWLDGMNLLSIITRNMKPGSDTPGGPVVSRLLSALERAIIPMLDEMLTADDMAHIIPRLTLHPVLVPLTPGSARHGPNTPPYIVVFYANYDAAVNTFTDQWLPFNLFRVQNACVMAPRIATAARLEHMDNASDIDLTTARRPSRVQFDFAGVSQPAAPEGLGSYTFPARDESPHPSLRQLAMNKGPRRSSIRPKSSGSMGHGEATIAEMPKDGSLTGVGTWDADWLLLLLKQKLRADM